jgi:hypothetical protein
MSEGSVSELELKPKISPALHNSEDWHSDQFEKSNTIELLLTKLNVAKERCCVAIA